VKLLRESRTVKLDYITPQPAVTYPIFHSTIFDFQSIKRRVLLGVKSDAEWWMVITDPHGSLNWFPLVQSHAVQSSKF